MTNLLPEFSEICGSPQTLNDISLITGKGLYLNHTPHLDYCGLEFHESEEGGLLDIAFTHGHSTGCDETRDLAVLRVYEDRLIILKLQEDGTYKECGQVPISPV